MEKQTELTEIVRDEEGILSLETVIKDQDGKIIISIETKRNEFDRYIISVRDSTGSVRSTYDDYQSMAIDIHYRFLTDCLFGKD